jgi:hypothetical protein
MSDREIMDAKNYSRKSINNPNLHSKKMSMGEYNNVGKLKMKKDLMNSRHEYFKHMPNQKWHKIISFIKSGIRILGYAIIPFDLVIATLILIISEMIGIIEELV